MRRTLGLMAALLVIASTLAACVVAPPPGYRRPGCPWVPGHYGERGVWHPGHCA